MIDKRWRHILFKSMIYGIGTDICDVRRIRAKFRELGRDPIETVHGVGYKAAGA